MRTETITIQVQRYTDDNGNPTCEGCAWGDGTRFCDLIDDFNIGPPGKACPIWNNAVKHKWATFRDWLISGGYISAEDDGCPPELLREMVAWEAARK